MRKILFKSYFIKTLLPEMLIVIICMGIIIGLNACANKNNTQVNREEDNTGDTTKQSDPTQSVEDETMETMKVTVDGNEYTLYFSDDYDPDDPTAKLKPESFPAVILRNSKARSVPPTLVYEGDMFLGWKAVKIGAEYVYYDDGRMYPHYYDGVSVQFEGEATIKATIDYYNDFSSGGRLVITPDDEYQELFPAVYDEREEYKTIFSFPNYVDYRLKSRINFKPGKYECEITVKDYYLLRFPDLYSSGSASVVDISNISVIEYYPIEPAVSESMTVTVDGIEYPLYLYSDYITKHDENDYPRIYSGNLSMIVLTNAITKTVPPTLVFQGDMFLDWEVEEIEVYHVFYEENGIIKVSCDEAVIKFKGEITIKAEIIYNWDEDRDDESLFAALTDDYQGRFPQIVNEEYGTGFLLGDINNKAAEILNNKYGRYECEITIKDYNLNNLPICIFSTATLVDMKVLSVIEYYESPS